MHVEELVLDAFMGHSERIITLPRQGIILVTGPNGSGKSSIIEGVAVGVWGKTLRGTSPWNAKGGSVQVVTPDLVVTRTRRSKKSAALSWHVKDEEPTDFDTPTKAQEALSHLVGVFNVWRRTHVFSSHDAAHFTMASDGERKRLLETLLGLDRFEPALVACRADLKGSFQAHDALAQRLSMIASKVESANGELDRYTAQLEDLVSDGDEAPLVRQVNRLSLEISEWEAEIKTWNSQLTSLRSAGADEAAEVRSSERRLKALEQTMSCPTCRQLVPAELIESIRADIARGHAITSKISEDAETKIYEAQKQSNTLQAELRDMRGKLLTLSEQLSAISTTTRQRASLSKAQRDTRLRVETLTDEERAKCTEHTKTGASLRELEACEQILGLRGVRAHVLGRTLSGIEAVANTWLARIAGPDFSLDLKPYTEKKGGGVSDSISLEVTGAGGGFGYKASSGGERRRIDVALLLALAEVSGAAHSQQQGTLFFDEVFDSLDAEGVEAVSSALSELAQDRAVVVISHSEDFAAKLNAHQHIRFG